MFRRKKKDDVPPHMMGPPVEFTAMGGSDKENQANLIQARQSMGIVPLKETIAESVGRHAERVMLDYTQQGVGVRFDIDGVWHPGSPRDRQSGDVMLAIMKKIAALNPNERRSRQSGQFGAKFQDTKVIVSLVSQGTKTGERAILTIDYKSKPIAKLDALGMREALVDKYRELSADQGVFIISAPSNRGGMTTTWTATLGTTDRYMRDFVAIEDVNKPETDVENVEVVTYDPDAGENVEELLPKLLLKQPEVFVLPEVPSPKVMQELVRLVADEHMTVFLGVRAKDASEALLRARMLKPDPVKFAKTVKIAINSRLVRRLCEACRQAFPPPPALLQKLGIPPGRVNVLYKQWEPPPPDQQPKKKKGEPDVCPTCNGLGYKGRIAICEMLVVDDKIREALVKQPKIDVIRKLSRAAGNRTLQEEGILLVASGITSINELQRSLKG